MNQEFIKYRILFLYTIKKQLLPILILIITNILVLYLILILINFSNNDLCKLPISSYVKDYYQGDQIGVWLAKNLFLLFGQIAYLIPFSIFFYSYSIFLHRHYIKLPTIFLKLICYIILLFTSCGLTTIYFNQLYNFSSGGLIGYFLSKMLSHWFDQEKIKQLLSYLIIILLLVINWLSIINIIKKTISWFINLMKLIIKMLFYKKKNIDQINRNISTKSVYVDQTKKKLLNRLETIINSEKSILINTNNKLSTSNRSNLKKIKNSLSIKNNISINKNYSNISSIMLPTVDILTKQLINTPKINPCFFTQTAKLIENCLASYHIKVKVAGVISGPVITRFELDLAPGVKVSRISSLSLDLARALSTNKVQIVEIIPGKPYIGLDIANQQRQIISLREVFDSDQFRHVTSPLSLALGKNIIGHTVIVDLINMPHLLVAGTTGSGKSVAINAMILSILYKATPKEVRFIMIDPKMLELSVYKDIPHLLTNVITNMKNVADVLYWCISEMERRYQLMSIIGVRNLANYNKYIKEKKIFKNTKIVEVLPYIVIIIDELADLMMIVGKNIEELIIRLAQKARASGIHLVLATQRPSVDVITGLIKANIPTRIAFAVSSKIDSRTILDQAGAESLLGMGDMLYLASNSSLPIRVHGVFVRDEDIYAVVKYWKNIAKNN